MRLHHAIVPLAIGLAALRCTGSGFTGGGKAEKEEDGGEDKKGDKPVEVAGSFLVCGTEPDAPQAEKEDTYGCAAVDSTSKKRLASAKFTRLDVTVDGKQRKASPVAAPAGSFWHTLFRIPTGKKLTSVNGTGDFASAPAASASVEFKKPLGQAVDGEIPLEAPQPAPPEPTPPAAHLIFVTSQKFKGDLGGIAGANAKCNAAAKSAGLRSAYLALLSSTTEVGVAAQLLASRSDATNWAGEPLANPVTGQVLGPELGAPILYDEAGYEVHPKAAAWTGSDPYGAPVPENCMGWGMNNSNDGSVGYAHATKATDWLGAETRGCNDLAHLYCISEAPEPF